MGNFTVIERHAEPRQCLAVINGGELLAKYRYIDGGSYDYVVYSDLVSDEMNSDPAISINHYYAVPFDSQSNIPSLRITNDTKGKLDETMYAVECWTKYSISRTIVEIPRIVENTYSFSKEANEILDVCETISSEMHEALVPLITDVIRYLSLLIKLSDKVEV